MNLIKFVVLYVDKITGKTEEYSVWAVSGERAIMACVNDNPRAGDMFLVRVFGGSSNTHQNVPLCEQDRGGGVESSKETWGVDNA